jgi:hypothetical protein
LAKRCIYCGKYFTADKRVGDRQKSCGRKECRKARKHSAQRAWSDKNPGYFKGRYYYVKEWRQRRKASEAQKRQDLIQDKIPGSKPYWALTILLPEGKRGVIQDEIRLKRVDSTTFAAYGP